MTQANMLVARGFFGLRSGMHALSNKRKMHIFGSFRMISNGTENKADEQSAQKKLDQLADFLESRPQKPAHQSRGRHQKEQRSQGSDSRLVMPNKLFQNGHVRVKEMIF